MIVKRSNIAPQHKPTKIMNSEKTINNVSLKSCFVRTDKSTGV